VSTLAQPSGRSEALNAGVGIVAIWLLLAAGAGLITPFDPMAQELRQALQPPSFAHWLGTDDFGRDVMSRLIFSARLDLALALLGVVPPFVLGYLIGTLAGHLSGIFDSLVNRLMEAIASFPLVVLVLAIMAVTGHGIRGFFIAVAIAGWARYARIVRSRTRALWGSDFVAAGRALGYSRRRLLLRHILPNTFAPALALAASEIATMLLLVCSLGYLGLVAEPPTAEWGAMIAEGQSFLGSAWWISFFPGLAVILLAFGFHLAARGLRARLGVEG
jgi:peptide/nickel transport system permease protein